MAIPLTLYTLIVLPFIAALLIALISAYGRALHTGIAAVASAAGLLLVARAAPAVLSGEVLAAGAAWVPSIGLDFSLVIDPLGLMFAGLILGIGLLVVIFGHSYLAPDEATGRFSPA